MLKEKITKMLNEMGGGAGIEVAAEASDLSIPVSVNVSVVKGRMAVKNIKPDGTFPLSLYKFTAKGYQDGMMDVKGEVLKVTAHLPEGWKIELGKQIQAAMSAGLHEDIFKPATSKEIEKRRKALPIYVGFEIDSYSGELSDVVGGGYTRPGPGGFNVEWKDVGLKAFLEARYDVGGDIHGESFDLDGLTITVTASLNGKLGVKWYNDIFNPPDYDPDAYDSEQFGNDPETTMPEEMYWDMYWEDMEQEWKAR
jgi:hypothetical protein